MQKVVDALKMVNEHAIKLTPDFNIVLTKDDQQPQIPHQIAEHSKNLC